MTMLFKSLVPLTLYQGQKDCPTPKGEPIGKGEMICLLSPNTNATINLLTSGFLDYGEGLFKKLYMDYAYYETIGTVPVRERLDTDEIKKINETKFPNEMDLIPKGGLNTILKSERNFIFDFGKWNEIYFTYRRKTTPLKMSNDYISFIYKKISSDLYDKYHKTIFIDVAAWNKQIGAKMALSTSNINNPIAILLFLLYKNPDALTFIRRFDFMIFNSSNGTMTYIPGNYLTSENFSKIKSRLSSICGTELEPENIEDLDAEAERVALSISGDMSADKKREMRVRKKLRERISKNFEDYVPENELINIEDDDMYRSEYEEDEETGDEDNLEKQFVLKQSKDFEDDKADEKSIEDQIEDEIDKLIAEKGLDEAELIANDESDIQVNQMARSAAKVIYKNTFIPEYTKVQLNRIDRLTEKQNSIIRPRNAKEKLEALKIDETSLEGAVDIPTKEYLHPKFSNFDKSYNNKKLERDLDESVAILSTARKKIFVTDLKVEDTSDQMTLKETRTYHLEDEDGKKMSIKIDVPKVFDNHYVYIGGNKKILGHQIIILPIIKNKSDEVKINTFYNKSILKRKGREDASASPLLKYLMKNQKKFDVKLGNGERTNENYLVPLEFSLIGKRIYTFNIGDYKVNTSVDMLCEEMRQSGISFKKPTKTVYPIAYNTAKKEIVYFDAEKDSYAEKLLGLLGEDIEKEIRRMGISTRQFYATCEIMQETIPLALLILHAVGLTEMLKKANIKYEWIPRDDEAKKKLKEYHPHDYGRTELADGTIVWSRKPDEAAFLMNGINKINFDAFTREEMDDKDTFIFTLNKYYAHSNMSYNIDQFTDFMVDPVSKEILEHYGYPTNYIDLLILGNKMLTKVDYIPETDIRNQRIRSNDIIAQYTYKAIANAYNDYRKTANNVHPKPISVKQDIVMQKISTNSTTEEASIINPYFEIDRIFGATFHGENGINEARAFSVGKRAFTESMLGIIAPVTDNAGNVGINRYLTLEPNLVNTRGIIDIKTKKDLDDMSATQLLSPSELLTPMGVEHDDPARMAMAVKQSRVMIPVDASEPGMISNCMDKTLPYYLSKEFTVVAEDDGEVVDVKGNLIVVKYNNGRYQTIDTSPQMKHNSDAGFYIETQMQCDKKKGDKVKKNEIIGYDKTAFSKNNNDLGATMTRGPVAKMAIVPRWDCYEDSVPISEGLSEKMASTMVMEETASIKPSMPIHYIVKVGDTVKTGEPLITFDQYSQDEEVQAFMNIIRDKLRSDGDAFIENSSTSVKAHYTGEIADIKIFSTVPLEDMCPETRAVVEAYYKQIDDKIKVLKKYQNPGDNDYYTSGQRVSEFPEPVKANSTGFIKGERVGDEGIVFCFYIKFKDYIKKGDKVTAEFALKGINSQVFPEGMEPYSEFRPDEPIEFVLAPHSPLARKTSGVFKTMFVNKLLIEKKRQLMEYWNSVKDQLK